jgi:hypothetical protein
VAGEDDDETDEALPPHRRPARYSVIEHMGKWAVLRRGGQGSTTIIKDGFATEAEARTYARGEVPPRKYSARETAPGDWAVFDENEEPCDFNNYGVVAYGFDSARRQL